MAKNCKESSLEEPAKSLPYTICESKDFGRHFIATRDIKPLELILYDSLEQSSQQIKHLLDV